MPPSPIHPSGSMPAASTGDGVRGMGTPSTAWPWSARGEWEGPLGQLAQLALTAVHAAAAVAAGGHPPIAGGPASRHGAEEAGACDGRARLV
eukprot:scaffold49239_cov16-Tisochrysis_lutea.AAC.1